MANPEHVEVVKQGAEAIGQWREKNPGVTLDLREADLREVNLHGADLDWANLDGADLRRIILSGAKLRQANLSRTDLGGQPLLG
jgi:uncharacterized protein YjbI with pentapeptide repeats